MLHKNHTAGSVRCYLTFIGFFQKLVQFVLVPVIALAFFAVFLNALQYLYPGNPSAVSPFEAALSIYLLYIIVICDVLYERGNFGGTFTTRASYVEYMKSSPRGVSLYRNILLGGMIIRFCYALVTMGIFRILWTVTVREPALSALSSWVLFGGAAWLSMQTGALLTRFFDAENISMMASMISAMVISALFTGLSFLGPDHTPARMTAGIVALLMGCVLAVLMVNTGKKKKEKEYHDV